MLRRPLRTVIFALGWLFTAIGIVGIVLPGIPGTVFLILAAWCFTRSSPRFEAWLIDHPRLGPPIRQWRERSAIPRHAKAISIACMALSWIVLWFVAPPIGIASAGIAMALCALYIVTRPDA